MLNEVTSIETEVRALSDIMDKPNLVGLSYALRHPETWPKDFVWYYGSCTKCAVGLARRIWQEAFADFPKAYLGGDVEEAQRAQETFIARTMAMSHREATKIFFHMSSGTKKVKTGIFSSKEVYSFDGVTADDVADAIDKYLASAA